MKRRIFVSATVKRHMTKQQSSMRDAIIKRIKAEDLDVQIFDVGGIRDRRWTPQSCVEVMRTCQGAVLIGFPRWKSSDHGKSVRLASEFLQYEGVLARTMGLPILTIVEEGIEERGVIASPLKIPRKADETWLEAPEFDVGLQDWLRQIKRRDDVFLGYCSKASSIADLVSKHLQGKGLRVRDWSKHFRHARIILDELEEAARDCSCAIFVFSGDDKLHGTKKVAAPRDNVIFETGYFMYARGRDRVLILRAGAAKMPADLGGVIYTPWATRKRASRKKASVTDEMSASVKKELDAFINSIS
jgi:hypothetical protein